MTDLPISNKFKTFFSKLSSRTKEIISEENTFLVGGVVRDLILGKEDIKDIDIVTEEPEKLLSKFSRYIRTKVLLDEEFQVYRVFLKGEHGYYLDVSKLQGKDIIEDLSRRDFVLNSVALRYSDGLVEFIDPFNGIFDIQNKIIRTLARRNLVADPLRILRAFRLKAELGFEIDKDTKNLMGALAYLLEDVADERKKSELFKILNTTCAVSIFYELYNMGILAILFPFIADYKGYYCGRRHTFDLLHHSFKVMEIIEDYSKDNSFPIPIEERILNEETEYEAKIIGLMKLSALFHDIGKLFVKKEIDGRVTYYEHEKIGAQYIKEFLQKRRFSTATIDFIVSLIRWHMYLFHIMDFGNENTSLTPRIYMKIEKNFGERVPILFNFAISDSYATAIDSYTKKIIDNLKKLYNLYCDFKMREKDVPLLNGNEVMELLGISEGPMVGKLLVALKEASLEGKVTNKDEAKEFVKRIYEKGN